MVAILAGNGDMQIGLHVFRQRAKHMADHVTGQIADHRLRELSLEIKVKASAQIKHHRHQRLIHRQAEAIPPDTTLVAKRTTDRLTKRNRAILNAVMRVDLKVALTFQRQGKASMFGDLIQHVIIEPDSRINADRPGPVQIDRNGNGCLAGLADNLMLSVLCCAGDCLTPQCGQQSRHLLSAANRDSHSLADAMLM